ncbi:hypothetical protein FA09DRAFT_188364 [Tilletiopsis washingtonensis]|uniref:Uncharacterized protein n=1 Tax=Tilletiopsis washingtonensis TaxID=58919 RepID=A0A316ZHJ3_9BASI|nr:hypothetical protein FA09DRAFT_188364 [Tilletiopsis washingtonensis]PWO00505.1 hypothetical protein FA09DRAFT_188364 [Tilletiopsis washingtonensis]
MRDAPRTSASGQVSKHARCESGTGRNGGSERCEKSRDDPQAWRWPTTSGARVWRRLARRAMPPAPRGRGARAIPAWPGVAESAKASATAKSCRAGAKPSHDARVKPCARRGASRPPSRRDADAGIRTGGTRTRTGGARNADHGEERSET